GRDRRVALAALRGPVHRLAVEADVLVDDVARPRINHLRGPVAPEKTGGAERDGLPPIEVDVRATPEQRAERDEQRRDFAAGAGGRPLRSLLCGQLGPPSGGRGCDRRTAADRPPPTAPPPGGPRAFPTRKSAGRLP